ncbi:uncharacterized protein NFAT isoform X3 [Atheta coriaria]|uniref:uncharacterized protein NFAT isoform X3 n=1 Tax=Dalotia coriaria TaxID=877792 RepID=UPI0031F3F442
MPKRPPKGSKKASSKPSKTNKSNGSMKMTMYTAPTMVPRQQTKERLRQGRPGGKRLAAPRSYNGKARSMARRCLDPCDNSNDSGLGFDHHVDRHNMLSSNESLHWADADRAMAKRQKVDVKLENDEVNDNYSFPEHTHTYRDTTTASTTQGVHSGRVVPRGHALLNSIPHSAPITLTSQLQASSRYRDISLSIIYQPEQQHRARYQTEGSRGAVKDRSGNGFPVVQLVGYNKPATLQVFIGSDQGKVAPHMFYQACKVSGKNSTPCNEKTIDGTIVIELQLEPGKDMQGTCDCVGILKERNVDVEHRFPDQLGSRAKKKSTRCRMVFRTTITHTDGMQETLQVCSQPIVCTQPPGVPEISKKSLTSCPASGGLELFIIGKNFLKDTVVYFQTKDESRGRWEQSVVPDKEFLQQTHLICVVPQFFLPDITEPVSVRMYVMSSGKTSEPHSFVYTPVNGAMPSVCIEAQTSPLQQVSFLSKIMPPPDTSLVPLSQRRLSAASIVNTDSMSPPMRCNSSMKQEFMDENSQNSVMDASELQPRFRHISESSLDVQQGDSNLSMINDNSMDMMHHQQMVHANMNENSNLSLVNENSMDMMSGGRTSVCGEIIDETSNHYSPQRSPEMKVMDLRRKMPMATVADLVNTKEPSMATLQSFGMMEHNLVPLPAQTAQSIENYLTNIENKNPFLQQPSNTVLTTSSFMAPQMMSTVSNEEKHEAGTSPIAVAEAALASAQHQTVIQNIENGLLNNTLGNTMPTERLNVLVNCGVESMVSPKESNMLLSQDVMMPSMINTNLTSPLAPPALNTPNSNISPEVILNSQISPSLMCRSATQDALLPSTNLQPICQSTAPHNVNVETTMTNPLLSSSNTSLLVVNGPENAIILSAAADLLETQKNISEILTTTNGEVMPMSQLQTTAGQIGNNFFTTADNATLVDTITKSMAQSNKDFMMPVTVSIPMQGTITGPVVTTLKEMQNEKKCEEELRMVPPSLATMSENDLINIINPSCFDQGNNAMH